MRARVRGISYADVDAPDARGHRALCDRGLEAPQVHDRTTVRLRVSQHRFFARGPQFQCEGGSRRGLNELEPKPCQWRMSIRTRAASLHVGFDALLRFKGEISPHHRVEQDTRSTGMVGV